MGCVYSKPDINDQHANIFQVINTGDLSYRFSTAKLEVSENYLTLHQRGKGPIRWPLRCLRRYGFDAELFNFESGRRCRTGPGIYTFRCRRAEALFNMVQLQIQNITEDTASRELVALPSLNESQGLIHDDTRNSRSVGATDLEGYPEPRSHPRVLNSASVPSGVATGVTVNRSGVGIGSAGGNVGYRAGSILVRGNSVAVGATGGAAPPICRLASQRSRVSPPSPLSPPPVSFYENSYDLARTEELPLSSSHDASDPPLTPTEQMRSTFSNHIDKTVTYENRSGRSSSCGNMRRPSHLNSLHGKRRLRPPYINAVSSKPHEVNTSDIVYVNVGPDGRNHDCDHVYVNFSQDRDVPVVPPRPSLVAGSAGSGSSHSGTTTTTDTDQQPSQINYIILDLDHGSDSSQTAPLSPPGSVASGPESPHRMTESYAKIDFAKTAALITAKAPAALEDGSRKTRHNSTFTNPATLTRHNSSLSD